MLDHHVETENLHVTNASASVTLNRDTNLRTIASRVATEPPWLTVQVLYNIAERRYCLVEHGTSLLKLLSQAPF